MQPADQSAAAGEERLTAVGAALLVAIGWALGGCTATPHVPEPDGTTEPRDPYADVVISYGQSGAPEFCTDQLPDCETQGTCGPVQILGAPDGEVLVVSSGESVIVGFRCSSVRELGGIDSADMRIWAQVPEGSRAVISVSLAGNEYFVLDELARDDQEFDLARVVDFDVAQYVQIVHSAGEAIAIDAIEALRMASESE